MSNKQELDSGLQCKSWANYSTKLPAWSLFCFFKQEVFLYVISETQDDRNKQLGIWKSLADLSALLNT